MRLSQQLPLVGLLLFLLFPAHLCEICAADSKQQAKISPLMTMMIQTKERSPALDPSILIALRLARQDYKAAEKTFLERVKQTITEQGETLSSGQLALNILALTAACETHFVTTQNLVTKLEVKFRKELNSIGVSGHPLTNYYQVGLDALTLCLLNGTLPNQTAEYLSVKQNKYYFAGQFFVDTGAVAVLALTCLNRKHPDQNISNTITQFVGMILKRKTKDGIIGNIYSTGKAMQALFVSSEHYDEGAWNCNETLQTVINQISEGTFRLPITAAQVLPALEGKTYLDITQISCLPSPSADLLHIWTPKPGEPTRQPTRNIFVTYRVVDLINDHINDSTSVSVPKGSVFLKVMEAAQAKNYTRFWFTTESSDWGPYVTSVRGIEANSNDRTYWQLLCNDQPLSQGAGSFVVSADDRLEVKLSKY